MDDHPRRSVLPGSSLPPQEDTTGLPSEPTGANEPIGANESTGNNESAGANEPVVAGPSHWSSDATLEILQAHLAAGAETGSDEDGELRVHPDLYSHLARLEKINETNRVNARREAQAQFQAYQPSQMLNGLQHQASRILSDPRRGSSQIANQPNRPSYYASTERESQPSVMGMFEPHGTQHSTANEPFGPIPPARFDTSDPEDAAHPSDPSSHARSSSPYPMITQRQPSAGPRPPSNPLLIAPPMVAPQQPRYTEYGNPYTLSREPDLMPDDAITCAPDRMLQAWLLRQQIIAGVRPENLQPMSNPQNMRHRTPPWIIINNGGAHIVRMEPARFQGAMLPMPDLPWFPRRANPNLSTEPASSDAPDASNLPPAPNIPPAPSSACTQDSPVDHDLTGSSSPVANLPVGHNLSASSDSPPANSPVDTDSSASRNSPVDPDPSLSTAVESLFAPPVRAAPIRPAISRQLGVSNIATSPVGPGISAPPNTPVVNRQGPDPRVVAFLQPLRLHEPADTASPSAGALQSQTSTGLTVQNRIDADSVSSQDAPSVKGDSSAASSEVANGNGNGAVPHGVSGSESEDSEESDGPVSPRLRRFLLDGTDD